MSASRDRAPRPLSRLPRVLVLALVVAAVGEAGSYAALWWLLGARPTSARIERQLAASTGVEELDLRTLIDPRAARRGPYLAKETVHPYLGYLPVERAVHQLDGAVSMNTAAFFEPGSPVFSPSADEVVIGITGGSVAVFFAREGRRVLAEELARHPRFAGRRIRFAVLAFGGFKQPQQLMAMTYLLALGGRVDLLINLDGFNDVCLHASTNELSGVAPSYPRDWLLRAGTDPATAPALGELALFSRRRAELAEGLAASPVAWSSARRLVWKLRDRAVLADLQRANGELKRLAASDELARVGPRLDPAPLEELVRVWQASSLQLDRLCRANGIEYHHFLQPNQYVAGSKPLSAEELQGAIDERHPYGREAPAGYARLIPACRELSAEGVRCADLTGVFADVRETLYVDACCHINELGNQLLARAIAQAILAS